MGDKVNSKYKTSNTGWIIGSIVAVVALIALAVGLTFGLSSSNEEDDTYELDDTSLYIGTYCQSQAGDSDSSGMDWFSNTLYFYCYENDELFSSIVINGLDLVPESNYGFDFTNEIQSSQFVNGSYTRGDWGFMDVSSLLPNTALEYGISFWASLNEGNYFTVCVEWNGGPFTTSYFDFSESGIWFFNSPVSDGYVLTLEGDSPSVAHALIYNRYTYKEEE